MQNVAKKHGNFVFHEEPSLMEEVKIENDVNIRDDGFDEE